MTATRPTLVSTMAHVQMEKTASHAAVLLIFCGASCQLGESLAICVLENDNVLIYILVQHGLEFIYLTFK